MNQAIFKVAPDFLDRRRFRAEDHMAKGFAARLKTARLAEGLSQTDLAVKVGVTQPAVSNWELGNVEPRAAQLGQIERVPRRPPKMYHSWPLENVPGVGGHLKVYQRR